MTTLAKYGSHLLAVAVSSRLLAAQGTRAIPVRSDCASRDSPSSGPPRPAMGKRAAPTIVPPAAQLPRAKSGRSIGKELSAQPATPKAEPAKDRLAPADPLAEDCAALGGLLGQAQGLPTSCQDTPRCSGP
ncbi:unnamed protein product [Prorocentrum cordatum]|uniref:Secreted protein n=1 Tax=Prorocentrum cordatum TaxID=2364126 RepID=A0ABN9VLS5_9DINO|nr:unnamed protein product [Polarella glacialis]